MRIAPLLLALAACGGAAPKPTAAPAPAPTPAPDGIKARLQHAITSTQAGDLDRAFVWLERALAGGAHPKVIESKPELAAAIADPRWQELVAKNRPPCQE